MVPQHNRACFDGAADQWDGVNVRWNLKPKALRINDGIGKVFLDPDRYTATLSSDWAFGVYSINLGAPMWEMSLIGGPAGTSVYNKYWSSPLSWAGNPVGLMGYRVHAQGGVKLGCVDPAHAFDAGRVAFNLHAYRFHSAWPLVR